MECFFFFVLNFRYCYGLVQVSEYEANTNSLVCLPTGRGEEEYLAKYILCLELLVWNGALEALTVSVLVVFQVERGN